MVVDTKYNLKGQCQVVYAQNLIYLQNFIIWRKNPLCIPYFIPGTRKKKIGFVEKFAAATLILGPYSGTVTDDEDSD